MIRPKHIIITLVLLGGAGLSLWLDQRASGPQLDAALREGLLPAKELGQVTSVELSKEGAALSLKRDTDGRWNIAGPEEFPVSGEKLVRFLEDWTKVKVVERVGGEEAQWAALELDKPSRVEFKGDKDRSILNLYLGKLRTGGGQYLRIGDKPASYLVSGIPNLEFEAKAWDLKKLLDLKSGEIKELVFTPTAGSAPATLSRAKAEDKFALKDAPDPAKVKSMDLEALDTLLSGLSYSERTAISPEQAAKLAQGDSLAVTTFSGASYQLRTAELGPAGSTKSYVYISGSGAQGAAAQHQAMLAKLMERYLFEIDSSLRTRLSRGFNDFLLPADTAAAAKPESLLEQPKTQ